MDLEADINWIQKELKEVKDPALIEIFKNLLKYRNKLAPERISIEQYNQELELSEKEIEDGHFHTQKQVMEEAAKWGKE